MKKKKVLTPEIEKLKSFKKRSGWGCKRIAENMGIHEQTIYFWLIGRFNPSRLALEKVKEFLRIYDY